jgi:hypothetical protein
VHEGLLCWDIVSRVNSSRVLQGAPVTGRIVGEQLPWREVHVEPWYSSMWQQHLDDTAEPFSYLQYIVPLTMQVLS